MEHAIAGYELLARIGGGGFGTVYRARRAGIELAVKIAHRDPESRARLAREIELLGGLASPHVPVLHDRGELADGTPFVAMELVAAPNLAARIAALDGPLAAPGLAELVLPIVEALVDLHERGVVHRDLKPENVLLGDRAVLVDLGLADDGLRPPITEAGAAAGTAIYMAPEQAAGAAVTPASDVYALGVMMFELVTGRPPFLGSDAEIRVAHQAHRPPAPCELAAIPPALDAVIRDCLAKDPARRPRSDELAMRLAAAIDGDPGPARTAAAAMRTQVACAVLAFDGPGKNAARTIAMVAAHGGELVVADRDAWVAVFCPLDAARPVERARCAADDLVAAGLAARAVIDVRELALRIRGDGTRRVITDVSRPAGLDRAAPGCVVVSDTALGLGAWRERTAPDEPAFVGRDALIEQLVEHVRGAIAARRSQRITVVGDPGMGRTRLGRQLAERLCAGSQRDDGPAGPPRIAWLDLSALARVNDGPRLLAHELLSLPRTAPADPAAVIRLVVGGDDADGHAALAHALGWAAPEPASDPTGEDPRPAGRAVGVPTPRDRPSPSDPTGEVPRPAGHAVGVPTPRDRPSPIAQLRAIPGAYRGALARALGAAIARAAEREPLVVLVDDAQLADATTLDAIRIASDRRPAPLAFCLLSARPLWDGEPGLRLAPLDDRAAAALARDALRPASDIPAAVIAQIVARSGGVPRSVVELARSLHASGAIRRRARGGEWYLEAAAISELSLGPAAAEREIAALDPALRAHAGVLALLAPGFTAYDVEHITLRIDRAALPLDPGVALARLAARGIVTSGEYRRFASAAVRDALAAGLPADLVRRAHAAAIAHYEALAAARPHDRIHRARLAPHVAAGGDVARATALLLELGDGVRDQHDYLGAEQLYGRALELGGGGPEAELAARRGRAAARYRLGRYEDALVDYARARALTSDPAALVEIWLDEATALDWMGEYARSAECLAAATAATAKLGASPSPLLAIRRLVAEGRALWRRNGPCEQAVDALERALAGSRALPDGDDGYDDRIAAMVMLVYLLPLVGRLDDAEAMAGAAIALCEARGDRHHLMAVLTNRQVVSLPRGLADRAIADLERAGQLGHELGMPIQRYRTALGLAEIHRRLGRHAEARRHAEHARAIETESSAAGVQQTAAVMLVQILAALGDAAAARDVLAGVDRSALLDEDRLLARGMELALARGDDGPAWAALLDDTARSMPAYLPDLLEQRARAAHRDGRLADARCQLAAAVHAAEVHDPVALGRLRRALALLEAPDEQDLLDAPGAA